MNQMCKIGCQPPPNTFNSPKPPRLLLRRPRHPSRDPAPSRRVSLQTTSYSVQLPPLLCPPLPSLLRPPLLYCPVCELPSSRKRCRDRLEACRRSAIGLCALDLGPWCALALLIFIPRTTTALPPPPPPPPLLPSTAALRPIFYHLSLFLPFHPAKLVGLVPDT
ncbi:hypothetical protein CC80DRAFT_264423 [Byssothecium circinans]|uniref:Uncharacterized protein n=1 Tax=Byssothecium circinans TaxID=147558 RepID=A0A6A5U801_9PLEO|nr:hypothetical protein CC80DRAFT_264423 [Byssothecium circinans]